MGTLQLVKSDWIRGTTKCNTLIVRHGAFFFFPLQVVAILLKSGQYSQTYLQRSGMPHSALLLAAKSGHNDIIALLINHGFDINRKLQGYSGNCLHEAILYGKVETVRYLLQVLLLLG